MSNPINISSGDRVVDMSVVPYIRASEVVFNSFSMKPGSECYFYFDETNVKNFVQKPSQITTPNTVSWANVGTLLYNPTTHAVVSVLGTSYGTTSNTVFISENFLTLNLSQRGANTLTSTSFSNGDIIYQATGTTQNTITFLASVAYWNVSSNTLVVVPERGTLNLASSGNIVSSLRATFSSNVDSFVGRDRLTGGVLTSTSNGNQRITVSTYIHNSGIVVGANANSNTIHVMGPTTNMVGNTLYITSGTGINQIGNVISVSANTAVLDVTLATAVAGNSRYSVGRHYVDNHGVVCGIFNIPELSTARFLTGERVFSITDKATYGDSDAGMTAKARYVSSGFLNLTQQVQTPTVATTPPATQNTTVAQVAPTLIQDWNDWEWSGFSGSIDPVAQTFFTPAPKSNKINYGIFVSSVDLWFKTKPSTSSPQFPVELRIVETDNGYPTKKIVARTVVRAYDVKTSDIPDASLSSTNATKTNFRFPDPVYLEPSSEYALVIVSESPEYEVWIAELGQDDITDVVNTRRISQQPYAGSFFRSQNASLWTPYQNQDLMFAINKAVFDTSADAVLVFKPKSKEQHVLIDDIMLQSSDISFPGTSVTYKFNATYAHNGAFDSIGNFLTPDNRFRYSKDLKSSSSTTAVRRRAILASNADSATLTVTMRTNDSDVSPMFNAERISSVVRSNYINNGEIYPENLSITTGGFHQNAANITVTFSSPDLDGGVTATANVTSLSSGNVTSINMISYGSGYVKAPTVTITEPAIGGRGPSNANATVVVAGEDRSFGGNGYARYLTRKITLADGFDAGDLRIFINCVRPVGTQVLVYYKVLSNSDPDSFADKKWIRMTALKDTTSPDQITPIELQFAPAVDNQRATGILSYEENGITYPLGGKFKHFAIKIVLFAEDPSVIPIVKALRGIAVPAG